MNGNATRLFRLGVSLAGLVTLGWVLTGQAARPVKHKIGLPTDWTHRHLIFSHPRTAEQGARLTEDVRHWQQVQRRAQQLLMPAGPVMHAPIARDPGPKKFKRDWSENLGTGAKAGVGVFPAKFSFDVTTANCGDSETPDFVAFGTGVAGGVSQPSIVAFDNLYNGCAAGAVPDVYWAYNTLGTISTSPVLSLDGTQLAFMQTIAGQAELVVLKWAATTGTLTVPALPTVVLPAAYQACPAPCMTEIVLQTLAPPVDDTTSSVYYDYSHDIAWVGDAKGHLHKFTTVFGGTPTEVTAVFPKQVSPTSAPLSSPVYDRVTNSVFVSDTAGFLYRVQALSGTTVQSGQMEFSAQTVLPPPIVDAAEAKVYFFSADDGVATCETGTVDCAGVYQLQTNFASGATGTEAVIGDAAALPPANPIFAGSFDNAYLTSETASGNLYVCGNTGSNPTLYQVPISNGSLVGNAVAVSVLAVPTWTPRCSPVTDVSIPSTTVGNPAAEKVFVSVQHHSSLVATCTLPTGGCIQSFVDTPWQPLTNYAVGQEILVQGTNPSRRRLLTVVTAGTSGATPPIWSGPFGSTITEGTVTWMYQGNPALIIHPWIANQPYTTSTRVLDSNGNVQIVTAAGTSGASEPITWGTAPGVTTAEGPDTLVWTNAGAWPLLGLIETQGTSGIIIDNTVDPTTLNGTSQVYFTTLGDQVCGTSGTGGCAVQASQSGLN